VHRRRNRCRARRRGSSRDDEASGTTDTEADVTAFAAAVALTRREAFDVLEACAEAERVLLRYGRPVEAASVAAVFELLENRLVLDPLPVPPPYGDDRHVRSGAEAGSAAPGDPDGPAAGSNSSDSEFTQ
jgi:hypothetical protein